jgi:hypothetical protein
MRLIDKMSLDFTAYYDNEEFIGFTIVYPRKSVNWYWYFAVFKIDDPENFKVWGTVIHLIRTFETV